MSGARGDGAWPPLWALPLLVIAAIWLAVHAAVLLGPLLGWLVLVPLGIFTWWVQARADRHVRRRQRRA